MKSRKISGTVTCELQTQMRAVGNVFSNMI